MNESQEYKQGQFLEVLKSISQDNDWVETVEGLLEDGVVELFVSEDQETVALELKSFGRDKPGVGFIFVEEPDMESEGYFIFARGRPGHQAIHDVACEFGVIDEDDDKVHWGGVTGPDGRLDRKSYRFNDEPDLKKIGELTDMLSDEGYFRKRGRFRNSHE